MLIVELETTLLATMRMSKGVMKAHDRASNNKSIMGMGSHHSRQQPREYLGVNQGLCQE